MKEIFKKYKIENLVIVERFSSINHGFHIVDLLNHEGEISISNEEHNTTLSRVKKLTQNKPIVLVFNDDYVVTNSYPETEHTPKVPEDIIEQVFNFNNHNIISFVRKSEIEDLLKEMNESLVIDLVIGPGLMFGLFDKGLIKTNTMNTTTQEINFDHSPFVDLRSDLLQTDILVGDEQIPSHSALSLACGVHFFLNGNVCKLGSIPQFDIVRNEHYHKYLFNKIKQVSLLLFPVIIFISIWAHRKCQNEFSVYQEQYQNNKLLSGQLDKKIKEVDLKLGTINTFNLNGTSEYSYFLTQVGLSSPKKVVLNKLYFNKIDQSSFKDNEIIKSKVGSIEILGFTPEVTSVNSWIKELTKNKYIKNVSILELDGHKKDNNFKIEINLE